MDKIEKGLALLSVLRGKELSIKETTEILGMVTQVPQIIHEILKEGERKGLLRREKGKLYISSSTEGPLFEVRRYECVSHCSRCGRRITSCYYFFLDDEEFGPFGSDCVRKLRLL